jgi:hypothetical protein
MTGLKKGGEVRWGIKTRKTRVPGERAIIATGRDMHDVDPSSAGLLSIPLFSGDREYLIRGDAGRPGIVLASMGAFVLGVLLIRVTSRASRSIETV